MCHLNPRCTANGRHEYMCGHYHRSVRAGTLAESKCLRNGLFQDEVEPYIARYLEDTGKRLELLARRPTAHVTGRLTEQQESAWDGFCKGVDRLIRYLATHHPEEYARLVREDAVRHEVDKREAARWRAEEKAKAKKGARAKAQTNPPAWANQPGPELVAALDKAVKADAPPPEVFVSRLIKSYRANFDPSGLSAEIAHLENEHTTHMRRYADLPTPRAKEKAATELAALEEQIAELERQREDVSAAVLTQWRELQSLSVAVTKATAAMNSETGEHALRQRAEALGAIVHRIECAFVATGRKKGGVGNTNARLVSVTFYPVGGETVTYEAQETGGPNVIRHTPV